MFVCDWCRREFDGTPLLGAGTLELCVDCNRWHVRASCPSKLDHELTRLEKVMHDVGYALACGAAECGSGVAKEAAEYLAALKRFGDLMEALTLLERSPEALDALLNL